MYGLKNRSSAVDKYRVTLEADERATLERLVAVGKGAARRLTHARILLLADTAAGPERSDADIGVSLAGNIKAHVGVPGRRGRRALHGVSVHQPEAQLQDHRNGAIGRGC